MKKPAIAGIIKELANKTRLLDLFRESLAVAYYVTLSFFPILIALSTLMPYFNIDIELLASYMDGIIPGPVLDYILPFVNNLLSTPHVGVLSLSVVVTIWSASQTLTYLQTGIDRMYSIENARIFLTTRIFSIVFFIAVSVVLVFLMALITFEVPIINNIMNAIDIDYGRVNTFQLVKWGGTFTALFIFFSVIYYILPNIKHKFRNALPGALFSALLVLLMVNLYALYLRYETYSLTAYGALSAFFILLIWIRVLAFITLLGALLNAVLLERKHGAPVISQSRLDDKIRDLIDNIKHKFTRDADKQKNK